MGIAFKKKIWTLHPSPCPKGEINFTEFIRNFSSYLETMSGAVLFVLAVPASKVLTEVILQVQYLVQGFLDK